MRDRYHFQIGDFHCLAINDGEFIGNAEMLFANAPEEELLHALQQHGLTPDYLPSTWTCLLVETPTDIVLVDTGYGEGGQYGGQLLSILRDEGYRREDVNMVILTHAHADHIGGCVDGEGKVAFPQATFYMGQDEWDFWTNEGKLATVPGWAASVVRQKLPPLAAQLQTIDTENEIAPGIRAIPAPGHTAGHLAVEVESNGESLLHIVDTALHPIQVEHPDWYSHLDQFPEQTVATRHAIFERAAARDSLVVAFHFPPFPSLGHIVGENSQWGWQPLQE